MSGNQKSFYCKGDGMYHYKDEIPKNLRQYVDHTFSSGGVTGSDYKSFQTKYKNFLKKVLPEGYSIAKWCPNHYQFSCVIENDGHYVYVSISDVRYWHNEWMTNILVRTMKHDSDWTGGRNQYASIFNLVDKVKNVMAQNN
jgi:hypothetical protein